MKTISVKICGVRDSEIARAIVEAGTDFIGLNFVPTSKQYIDVRIAQGISEAVRGKVKVVGVFRNQQLDYVNHIVQELGLDYAQLHGDENPVFCQKVKTNIIKAFQLSTDFHPGMIAEKMKQYHVDYYLLDRKVQGEGEMLRLEKVKELTSAFPIMFAGGLTPENVLSVVREIQPLAVDVSGGVETDGKKDIQKIQQFIRQVRQ